VVAQICRRLDGLPLAIELAAALARTLPPQDMLARLGESSQPGMMRRGPPRLDFLEAGGWDLPDRQQTVRATIAWSYDLLEAGDCALFRRLSLFVGGATLAAIADVCAVDGDDEDCAHGVHRLAAHSLVSVHETAGGQPRVTLLETIREYGLERLDESGEADTVRRRHAAFFLELAERAEPELTGPELAVWLTRLEQEHDNLRAALSWACTGTAREQGLRLAAALWRFWLMRGYAGEGRRWLDLALAGTETVSAACRAPALSAAGNLAYCQGDYEWAGALQEEAIVLWKVLGDRRGTAGSLNNLGTVAYYQGDYGRATALYEEALALWRELGDRRGIAGQLNNLGMVAYQRAEYVRAAELYQEGLALQRAQENAVDIAGSLGNLGLVVYRLGDYRWAAELQEEALALQRAQGDRQGVAITLGNLGLVVCRQGDYARAAALHEESLAMQRELGDRHSAALTLTNLGEVALLQGDHARAEMLCEEALALQRELGDRRDIATSLTLLGTVSHMGGDHERAAALFAEGLHLSHTIGVRDLRAEGLEGLAWLAAARGQFERAALLGGSAEAMRAALAIPLVPAQRAGHEQVISALRAALSDETFAMAWAAGRSLSLDDAVDLALENTPAT
jgi:tetratricopeptide (TPR) repeat protein